MSQQPFQIGWIPYWNLLPLQFELNRMSEGQLKVQSGHPSIVNRWLNEGTVQLAPASSIALLKSKNLELAMPIGIASEGPVQSVYIGLQREHEDFLKMVRDRQSLLKERIRDLWANQDEDIRNSTTAIWSATKVERTETSIPQLLLTGASAASAALTRVLLNLWCGEDVASHVMAQSLVTDPSADHANVGLRPIELVIGDEALVRRTEFWKVLDLGQIWVELTGLPFVFAVWQTSCGSISSQLKHLITEACSIAQARMIVQPYDYFPASKPVRKDGSDVDLASYWKVIQYRLTERHLKSLLFFYALYLQTSGRAGDEQAFDRFLRWNKVWLGADGPASHS